MIALAGAATRCVAAPAANIEQSCNKGEFLLSNSINLQNILNENTKSNNLFCVQNILNMDETIASQLFENIDFPWEVLPKISEFIIKLGESLPKDKFYEFGENIYVAKSAKVAKTACLNGPLIIDEGAEIRHCAYIRGSVIVGKNCVVGNSTELKNAILFNNVQVPHYNYIGDSILGYKCHFGAGSITSNVKSDKSIVQVNYEGDKIDTGLKKFGAIVGDGVEIGCNSVLNPGSIIMRNSNIYPLSSVRGVVPENSIFKAQNNIVRKN